jgi:hypothetical protein
MVRSRIVYPALGPRHALPPRPFRFDLQSSAFVSLVPPQEQQQERMTFAYGLCPLSLTGMGAEPWGKAHHGRAQAERSGGKAPTEHTVGVSLLWPDIPVPGCRVPVPY